MKMLSLLVLLILILPSSAFAQIGTSEIKAPRVQLIDGVLEGMLPEAAPGAVFKGVPFAQPPVGELRWHAPVSAAPWEGVKQAIAFGPDCAQLRRRAPGSEDCLYLNIWTPEWPVQSKHPVMLWVFGGANAVNSANNPDFDGSKLAEQGVVVVTINHRVGVMGFMTHPVLSAESEHGSSGNYALLDQLMALKWVQENIELFGGDPDRVTLFGQSSGSFDILLLMTSPLSEGLFHRAIAQAGQLLSFGGTMSKGRAEQIGVKIVEDLNAPTELEDEELLEYLRGLPAEQVMQVAAPSLPTNLDSDTGLLTNVDGWVLPELPAEVFASGRQMQIPLIVGNNAREIPMQIPPNELRQKITEKYGDLAPRAIDAYGLAEGGEGYIDSLLGGAGPQWMTDTVQRCARIMEAEWHSAAINPTWQYQFERSIPGREAQGAFHGSEVPFVFGTLDSTLNSAGNSTDDNTPAYSAEDSLASEQMQRYWVNFAKTGNPNSEGLPNWLPADDGRYMAFTMNGPVVKPDPKRAACQVFTEWTMENLAQ